MRALIALIKKLLDRIVQRLGLGTKPSDPDPIEYVDYYGCPNSKRAAALQLGKQRYR